MNLTEEMKIHNIGMSYEFFLTRAFKTDNRIKRASKQEFINLVNSENGKKLSFLPSFDKQLEEVKDRLEKAINIFIEKSNDDNELLILKKIESKITNIQSYKDINEIIEIGLENTKQFI